MIPPIKYNTSIQKVNNFLQILNNSSLTEEEKEIYLNTINKKAEILVQINKITSVQKGRMFYFSIDSVIYPIVKISNLKTELYNYLLDISKLEKQPISKNSIIIDYSAVLISLIGNKLRPTYFLFQGEPIAIGENILALKMNENIDIEYFIAQLHSRFVEVQLNVINVGTTIPRISTEAFLNINILLPSIEEQRKEILEIRNTIEKQMRLSISEHLQETRKIEHDIIATVSHNLNQKLGAIVNDVEAIKRFIEYKQTQNSLFQLQEPVAPLFEGETPDKVDSVEKVLNRLTNNLLDATKTLKTTENILQKEKVDTKPTEMYAFLMEIKNDFQCEMFSIEVEKLIEREYWVNLDNNAFGDVIKNLVNNAQKHGFSKDKYHHILFELAEESDMEGNLCVKISYKNDGKPFPKGFTFEEFKRLTGRAGKNKGTGMGGYFINKVIQLHKGQFFSIKNEYGSPYNIHFEILIPLIEN